MVEEVIAVLYHRPTRLGHCHHSVNRRSGAGLTDRTRRFALMDMTGLIRLGRQ